MTENRLIFSKAIEAQSESLKRVVTAALDHIDGVIEETEPGADVSRLQRFALLLRAVALGDFESRLVLIMDGRDRYLSVLNDGIALLDELGLDGEVSIREALTGEAQRLQRPVDFVDLAEVDKFLEEQYLESAPIDDVLRAELEKIQAGELPFTPNEAMEVFGRKMLVSLKALDEQLSVEARALRGSLEKAFSPASSGSDYYEGVLMFREEVWKGLYSMMKKESNHEQLPEDVVEGLQLIAALDTLSEKLVSREETS